MTFSQALIAPGPRAGGAGATTVVHGGRVAVGHLDRLGDALLERPRTNPLVDRSMYALSAMGDDGRVWLLAIGIELCRKRSHPSEALHPLVWLGIESAVVNLGLKRMARRARPLRSGEHPHRLRIPTDTSFPSGHAASAALMAVILAEDSPLAPVWFALAAGIGVSRVHVGVHHPTDVAAGWLVGATMGDVARRTRRWWRARAAAG